MVFDALLGVLEMPFFVVLLLICSYLIWSKFLNKNKLGIKNVNHLLDILIIFLFLLTSIGGFAILGLMFLGIVNLNFDLPLIMKTTPIVIGVLGVLFAISFVTGFRNKEGDVEDLEKSFKGTIKYFLIFALFIGSFYAYTSFTPLKTFVSEDLGLALFFALVVLIFSWNIVTNTLFGEKLLEKFIDKKSIPMLLGIFVLGLILSSLAVPLVNHQDIENKRILIYDADISKFQKTYFYSEANVSLITPGVVNSLPSSIVLDYGRYDFIFNKTSVGNRFEILAFDKEGSRSTVLDSYSDIDNDNFKYSSVRGIKDLSLKNGAIAIKFQRDEFKKNNIDYFRLGGLIETNISEEDFSYEDNTGYAEACSGDKCLIKIQINNSLDFPVDLNSETLVNLNSRNVDDVGRCKFNQVFVEYEYKNGEAGNDWIDCSKNKDCSVEIRRDTEYKSYDAFRMHLSNNGEGVIERSYTNIEDPMNVILDITLDCSD